MVFTGDDSGTIGQWDLTSGTLQNIYDEHTGKITCLIVADRILFSGSNDGTAKLWPYPTEYDESNESMSFKTLEGHKLGISALIYMPDDNKTKSDFDDEIVITENDVLVTSSQDGTAKSWSIATGEVLKTFDAGVGSGVYSMTVDPDGIILYTGYNDGSIRAWNIREGRLLKVSFSTGCPRANGQNKIYIIESTVYLYCP